VTPEDHTALIAQLMLHEGVRAKVYRDSLGIETIGCGRNLRDKGLSQAEIRFLLENDITECISDLARFDWFGTLDLDPVRQRALIDLRFNLGPSRLRGFKKLLAACARGDWDAAAAELLKSRWATQVQPSRVARLTRQLRTGVA
jgi:lysozyme